MPNTGLFWSGADIDQLKKLYAKKPYSQELHEWARSVTCYFDKTDNAIVAKVGQLRHAKELKTGFPRVLLFDIETLPMEVYLWQLQHNDYVQPENIIRDWCVSCWSAKWLLESDMHSAVLTSQEATDRNDERILKPLWKLINRADVVIGQNSNRFDLKKIATRFLFYNMGDPMPFISIDTLSASRAKFGFSSFKLDYMNHYLGLNGKSKVDMDDFRACAQGDTKALRKMQEYNKVDVHILEEFYMRIRAYIKHPNFAAWTNRVTELEEGEESCSVCGGVVTVFGGKWISPAGVTYEAFRCPHCQAIGRRTVRLYSAPRTKRA